MLGAALFTRPLLAVAVAPEYLPAADLIPIVCLAYLFFSLHEHFKVPVMLAKRTRLMPPVFVIAALTNIAANLLLIPRLGAAGAAWASVGTFAVFSFTGLWRYRTIDRYPYPLLTCGLVVTGMSASFVLYRILAGVLSHTPWCLGIGLLLWIFWAIVLFRPLVWRLYSHHEQPDMQPASGPDVFLHEDMPPEGRRLTTQYSYTAEAQRE
jgi:O-antigen/teichoic acid export membrane protein